MSLTQFNQNCLLALLFFYKKLTFNSNCEKLFSLLCHFTPPHLQKNMFQIKLSFLSIIAFAGVIEWINCLSTFYILEMICLISTKISKILKLFFCPSKWKNSFVSICFDINISYTKYSMPQTINLHQRKKSLCLKDFIQWLFFNLVTIWKSYQSYSYKHFISATTFQPLSFLWVSPF